MICWVLGEYGYLCESTSPSQIIERLCDTVERQFTHASTRCWVVVAMSKLVAQTGELPEQVRWRANGCVCGSRWVWRWLVGGAVGGWVGNVGGVGGMEDCGEW